MVAETDILKQKDGCPSQFLRDPFAKKGADR